MSRQLKSELIQCQYYLWRLRTRDGIYYGDGRLKKQKLGKYSLGTTERPEAGNRLDQLDLQKAIDNGVANPTSAPEQPSTVSIEAGWELYFARCGQEEILGGTSRATLQRYKAVKDKHVEFCAAKQIDSWIQIDKNTTLEYGGWLAKIRKLADRTLVLELNLICGVVKWLVEEKHLPPECRFLLKLSKPDGSTTYCYTREQVRRMIEFCNGDSALEWLARAITALVTTGLRINELSKLRWSDIDMAAGVIKITDERARPRRRQSGFERRLKGKRGRALPLNLELRKLLLRLPHHPDGLVFRGKSGARLSDRRVLEGLQGGVIHNLEKEFPTPDGEIGFKDGTVHGLRHFFVSEAYRNGATDAELIEWLGHRDSQLLRIYRHLRPEDGQRKMQQIDFLGLRDESQWPRHTA